jgi:hypothetical protein
MFFKILLLLIWWQKKNKHRALENFIKEILCRKLFWNAKNDSVLNFCLHPEHYYGDLTSEKYKQKSSYIKIYGSTDEPKYSKKSIFKHFFFMLNRTKNEIWFDASMVFNLTHFRFYGRKIISRHFQIVRISYQKLDFHRISRFSAVFIINILNDWRIMDIKS